MVGDVTPLNIFSSVLHDLQKLPLWGGGDCSPPPGTAPARTLPKGGRLGCEELHEDLTVGLRPNIWIRDQDGRGEQKMLTCGRTKNPNGGNVGKGEGPPPPPPKKKKNSAEHNQKTETFFFWNLV